MEDKSVHPEVDDPTFKPLTGGHWEWREPRHGEHWRTCSFCGSIHPDDLAAEEVEWRAEWADRKYGWPHKFYVSLPNKHPDQLFVIGHSNSRTKPFKHGNDEWLSVDDLNDEQRALVEGKSGLNNTTYYMFGKHSTLHAKFYSIHLKDSAISRETRERIAETSGLRFHFHGTKVSWERV
jgi:hypothetical protein